MTAIANPIGAWWYALRDALARPHGGERASLDLCWRALRERYAVIDPRVLRRLDLPWSGTATQLRNAAAAIVPQFVEPRVWDGSPVLPSLTVDRWREVARASRLDVPMFASGYGKARRGDYTFLGFYQQIYRAINVLRWTKAAPTWTANGETNQRGASWEGTGGTETWAEIKALLETEWNANAPTGPFTSAPWAYSIGKNPAENFAGTEMGARYAYAQLSGIPTTFKCAREFFAWAETSPSLYNDGTEVTGPFTDPNGGTHHDPPNTIRVNYANANNEGLLYRKFKSFSTHGPSNSATQLSFKLGSSNHPEWCDAPVEIPASHYEFKYKGYKVTAEAAILKWDVAGGFTFVD